MENAEHNRMEPEEQPRKEEKAQEMMEASWLCFRTVTICVYLARTIV